MAWGAWNLISIQVKALAAGAAAMQVRQIALNAAFGAATRSAQAMDATGVKAAAYSISQQLWLLAGVALFDAPRNDRNYAALESSSMNVLGMNDISSKDSDQDSTSVTQSDLGLEGDLRLGSTWDTLGRLGIVGTGEATGTSGGRLRGWPDAHPDEHAPAPPLLGRLRLGRTHVLDLEAGVVAAGVHAHGGDRAAGHGHDPAPGGV